MNRTSLCGATPVMPSQVDLSDITGTINLSQPQAVADAVCAILSRRCAGFDTALLRQGFTDLEDAFWGRYPGLLPCDTPYHDLRHSLSTTLLMARLVDGYQASHQAEGLGLGRDECALAVLLALFHDIGFLRRADEAHLNGASLIREHEQRGVEFMRTYLSQGPLAHFAEQAGLIQATNVALSITDTLRGLPRQLLAIGQLLGTADMVSQMAGRNYLERCHQFLFKEFVAAGADRTVSPSGEITVLYATADDLLRQTPIFYAHLVRRRLDEDFARAYRYIAPHFGGDDPYGRAMERNLSHLRELIRRNDFSSLRRKPVPLMPPAPHDLAPQPF